MDSYVPDGFIPPVEHDVIALERLVEDLTTASLNAADVAVIKGCVNRLILLLADAEAREAA